MMRGVVCDGAGGTEVLQVASLPRPKADQGQVLLKVAYSAVNRADTLQRQGRYPVPPGSPQGLGLEAVGEVCQLGLGVENWKVGDRAMALLGGGGNAEYVAVPAAHLIPVPEKLSFEQAACVPEVWLTAYQLLHFVAKIQPGDSVLVHAGGSGVGTAAVQLVKRAGGKSIVTAGSQAKIDLAVELGADKGVNYREEEFKDAIDKWTNGRGVDIILDCIGGSYSEGNLGSLATDGRWVVYGLMGGAEVSGPVLGGILRKRASLIGTTLRSRSDDYKAQLAASFARDCLAGFSDGRLKPVLDSVFPIEEIAQAHKKMEANTNIGKIVLKM